MRTITSICICALLNISVCEAQQSLYDVLWGNGNGIRFWQSDEYKIHMGNLPEYQFGPVTDYSIKTNMSVGTPGRGWTWGTVGYVPVAAINTLGNMQIAGSFFTGSNVGIGTNNPSNMQGWDRVLDVRGGPHSKILASSNGASYITGIYSHASWNGGGGFVGTESNHNLHLIANYSPKVSILTNGNVGVGTPTPGYKMEVLGAGASNVDLRVNGRIHTGDASNYGGVWVSSNGMFMGQVNANALGLYNNGWRIIADNNGNVGIGTTSPTQKLTVNGTIYGKEVKVDLSVPGPDYVFDEDYKLTPLEDIKTYIEQNKHLPEVPSAKEMEENGIQLGEMNMLLLKKIEELTLYVIELKNELQELKEKTISKK